MLRPKFNIPAVSSKVNLSDGFPPLCLKYLGVIFRP